MEKKSRKRRPHIWVVGGGKGGTGKTFIASSLGVYLAEKRKKDVLLIDADFGGANLHSLFGIKHPARGISHFFEKKARLEELSMETGINRLSIIPGDIHSLAADNILYPQKLKLFRHLLNLEARYIIIDVGGGSHYNIVDMFLFAEKGITVITPEILAVENLYQFIKNVIFRKLQATLRSTGLRELAGEVWSDRRARKITNIRELLDFFLNHPQTGEAVREAFSGFQVHLVLNKIRSMKDIYMGASVKSAFRKYLGIQTTYAGFLEFEETIRQSVQKQKPFLLLHPESRFAAEIEIFTENLLRGVEIGLWEE